MKKIIIITTIMLFFCSSVFADQCVCSGAWSSVTEYADDGADFFMIWLREDGRVFFLQQLFKPEKPGFYEAEIFTWLADGPDRAVITSENGQVCSLSAVNKNTLTTSDGTLLFRVPLGGALDGK